VGAVVVGFMQGPVGGLVILIVVVVGFPVLAVVTFRVWPQTPIGRRILLGSRTSQDVLPDTAGRRNLKGLEGKVGVAKSQMLPSGAITIDGRTIDAFSEGMPIDVGQRIVVISVRGTRVVVRPADEEPPLENEGDQLARPIDTISADPFEDPLA
jgi:membrane-bound serine protease (ClpP class)